MQTHLVTCFNGATLY